jgi:hypothetical protein
MLEVIVHGDMREADRLTQRACSAIVGPSGAYRELTMTWKGRSGPSC